MHRSKLAQGAQSAGGAEDRDRDRDQAERGRNVSLSDTKGAEQKPEPDQGKEPDRRWICIQPGLMTFTVAQSPLDQPQTGRRPHEESQSYVCTLALRPLIWPDFRMIPAALIQSGLSASLF